MTQTTGIDFNVLHHFVREWSFDEAQDKTITRQTQDEQTIGHNKSLL